MAYLVCDVVCSKHSLPLPYGEEFYAILTHEITNTSAIKLNVVY